MRPCGECTACCDGHLINNVYGNKMGGGKKCVFLVKQECTIYKDRPSVCSKYQCAWSQELLLESSRPDKTGLLVSVEIDGENKQYLKAIEMRPDVSYDTYSEIKNFCDAHNTYFVKVVYNER